MQPAPADVVIVGAGPCGSLVAWDLAARGASVVVLDAGSRFDPRADLPNDEANAERILWNDPRVSAGPSGVLPKTGKAIGGGSIAWLGVMPRFHPADFRTYSTEGVGADWPMGYDDLRPYYRQVEQTFGVAGECGPFFPEPYSLPMPAHRLNWHAQLLARGARALGLHPFPPPVAINSVPYDGRPACCYCGWCGSGCGSGAKADAVATYLVRAERRGATVVSDAFVHRIVHDARQNRVTGVEYLDAEGRSRHIACRIVVLAAHAVETPRLLLLSSSPAAPHGLANSSGQVGRRFMSHPTWQVFGTFAEPVNGHKGMQMGHLMVQDHYRPAPARAYARGFVLIAYMMPPVTYAHLSGSFIGADFKQFLYDYTHTAAWWAHAEGLPDEGNSVTLDPEVQDARGLPVARVAYAWGENDRALASAARDRAADCLTASGARAVRIGLDYGAHAMGSCRMGHDPDTSVVDPFCRAHDVPNLFICDTSVFVTGAGLNPTLTAMALASRTARHIARSARCGDL